MRVGRDRHAGLPAAIVLLLGRRGPPTYDSEARAADGDPRTRIECLHPCLSICSLRSSLAAWMRFLTARQLTAVAVIASLVGFVQGADVPKSIGWFAGRPMWGSGFLLDDHPVIWSGHRASPTV